MQTGDLSYMVQYSGVAEQGGNMAAVLGMVRGFPTDWLYSDPWFLISWMIDFVFLLSWLVG